MAHPLLRPDAIPLWARCGLPALTLAVLIFLPFATGGNFHFHIAIMVCLGAMAASGLAVVLRWGSFLLPTGLLWCSCLYFDPDSHAPGRALLLRAIGCRSNCRCNCRSNWYPVTAPTGGVYFVLITFALNELFRLVMLEFPSISADQSAIPDIPPRLSVKWF